MLKAALSVQRDLQNTERVTRRNKKIVAGGPFTTDGGGSLWIIRRSPSAERSALIMTACQSPAAWPLIPETAAAMSKYGFGLKGADVRTCRVMICKIVWDSVCRGCLNVGVDH